MNLRLQKIEGWDDDKFQELIDFRHKMQNQLPTFFPEEINDYKKLLHPDSPFSEDYQWVGFFIYHDNELVAQAILSWKKKSNIGNVGFVDWINNRDVANFLIGKIESFSKSKGLSELKTPIDLNFFIRYRIQSFSSGPAYFGEPIYPAYYHELFVSSGFDVIGTWDTYHLKRYTSFINFFKKRKKLENRKIGSDHSVKIRSVNLKKWDEELKIVFDLFIKSFKEMPEFDPISFEQFKLIYDDFKYIIHPLTSFIVEFKGVPVGFSINYPDPLHVLKSIKVRPVTNWQKFLLFIKLRLNFSTLLIPYMGKVNSPEGEEIKGLLVKISKKLSLPVLLSRRTLICYQSPDSPSRRPIDPELLTHYAQYVLYGKKLE